MDAYRVNPPLPRMIAAIPLLLDHPKVRWFYSESPFARIEYQFAQYFVTDNHTTLSRKLLFTRTTVLLFFALGLWSIVRWAWHMYGPPAAWTAAILWSLNPDVITHSAVVAPDMPASASGLFVGYLFWDWLRKENRPFPWSVAAATALAILCKFSWLFLIVLLPITTFVVDGLRLKACEDDEPIGWWSFVKGPIRDAVRLFGSISLTLLLINWCYGFDGMGDRLGKFEFISEALAGQATTNSNTGNRFAEGLLGNLPVPFPAEMIRGIDYLKWEFESGMPCYLNGKWQDRGWWYFHLYAMAVKLPLGYWVLTGGGVMSLIWQRWRAPDEDQPNDSSLALAPLLFAVVFMALVSSQTGFTHHVRYVMPVYGFLFLTASRLAVVLPKRVAFGFIAVCLSGTVWFHATHVGLAHTFFNPIAGGPNEGWRHLSYSNVDWGQSTYRMVDWVKEHPEQRPMTVLFRSDLGSPGTLIEDQRDVFTDVSWNFADDEMAEFPRRNGWYLISSYQMTLERNAWFQNQTPVAQPYPDVLLFFVDH